MRRFLTALALITCSIGFGDVARAGTDDTHAVIPVSYPVPMVNPCTGEPAEYYLSGEIQVHALPSVDAFFNGDQLTHLSLAWVMEGTSSDGYTAPRQRFGTATVNDRAGDLFGHVVVTETDNHVWSNDEGSRFKLTYRHHVTVIDGQPIVFADTGENLRCVHHPDA